VEKETDPVPRLVDHCKRFKLWKHCWKLVHVVNKRGQNRLYVGGKSRFDELSVRRVEKDSPRELNSGEGASPAQMVPASQASRILILSATGHASITALIRSSTNWSRSIFCGIGCGVGLPFLPDLVAWPFARFAATRVFA
jgi:hypothetical protein